MVGASLSQRVFEHSLTAATVPWVAHPFGGKLFASLLEHCARQSDFQTVAVIMSVLALQQQQLEKKAKEIVESDRSKRSIQTQHSEEPVLPQGRQKRTHPNNYSTTSIPELPETPSSSSFEKYHASSEKTNFMSMRFEDDLASIYDLYTPAQELYMGVLEAWNLHFVACNVRSTIRHDESRPDVVTQLYPACDACKSSSGKCPACCVRCSVCRGYVKSLLTICPWCRHGGHRNHLDKYFASNSTCPISNCGCQCGSFAV